MPTHANLHSVRMTWRVCTCAQTFYNLLACEEKVSIGLESDFCAKTAMFMYGWGRVRCSICGIYLRLQCVCVCVVVVTMYVVIVTICVVVVLVGTMCVVVEQCVLLLLLLQCVAFASGYDMCDRQIWDQPLHIKHPRNTKLMNVNFAPVMIRTSLLNPGTTQEPLLSLMLRK